MTVDADPVRSLASARAYDELRDPSGAVRPHWAYLEGALEALGLRELTERGNQARRLLHQDGATYTTNGVHQPWALDPVPFVFASDEWAAVERGIVQRVELLDLLVRDLYHDRRVLEEGLLPPEVVFGHDGFLRAVHGIDPPGGRALVVAACDMVRVADGSFVVLNDRTQAPSGAGYALENRRIMSQLFPSLFRDAHVHRLSGWFRALRVALDRLVPSEGGEGRIVVLTPGAASETYFEHAFLAANLGFPLVEGADLVVRHGRVWLRSLGGLEPVDVILRRVDDVWLDPLELRDDSWLGVAGLVEACRRGTVAIANPIGSGVVENPGLAPFLPAICEELMGQPLLLPTVASWWCGDPAARAHVVDRLPELVLRPISRAWSAAPVLGSELDADEMATWRRILATEPWRWVAQERLTLSHTPSLGADGLEGRPAVLRSHVVAEGDSYAVLAGGLTRIGRDATDTLVSNRSGGTSKDTWVLASEPERGVSLWSTVGDAMVGEHDERAIPSRASENLFWMGRYAERAEATIRLTRVVLDRLDDPQARRDAAERARLRMLLAALTHVTGTYPGFVLGEEEAVDHPEQGLLDVLVGRGHEGSLDAILRSLLAAAYAVRDRLSADTWQVVSDVEDDLAALRRLGPNLLAVRVVVGRLLRALLALAGLSQESMVRDAGWRLLDGGRRIERAVLLSSLTRSLLVVPVDDMVEPLVLESFLASTESLVAYRRRTRAKLTAPGVLDLVVAEPTNPRSLRHQLDRLTEDLAGLPHRGPDGGVEREERLVLDASTRVRLAEVEALAARSPSTGRRDALDELVVRVADLVADASDAMASRLFTHLHGGPRLLGTQAPRSDLLT